MKKIAFLAVAIFSLICGQVLAESVLTVKVNFTAARGVGKSAGAILVTETKYGLLFTPNLTGLKPGVHGFHVHVNPSCGNNGMNAGDHLDPQKTGKHLGPYDFKGHLGDLPAIYVEADGTAKIPVLAPKLKSIDELKKHSLMIHEGGDNYSDIPAKLGGGGGRMICGVVLP